MVEVRVRIGYKPREQFVGYHERTQRWACLVAHRRAGKTVACVNDLIRSALTCKHENARVAYIAPFLVQARDIAWTYAKDFTRSIPGVTYNESELRVDFPTGARLRLYGADNYDRLRGLGLDAIVLDEFADMDPRAWTEVIRACLSDRNGSATFIGTPKGRNTFWEIYDNATTDDEWFSMSLKASESAILPESELFAARSMMSGDAYNQEYECSFQAAVMGAYYASEIEQAEAEGRVCNVPHDPHALVHSAWDLGIGDQTAVIMFQQVGQEIHIIDHFEGSGVGLDWYVSEIRRRADENSWQLGDHYFPHDVRVKELSSGRSRIESLQDLGLNPIVVPQLGVDDGINAVRRIFPRLWIHQDCKHLLECIRQYRTVFDEKRKVFQLRPLHDFTSHSADALRYLAVGLRETSGEWHRPLSYDNRGIV